MATGYDDLIAAIAETSASTAKECDLTRAATLP